MIVHAIQFRRDGHHFCAEVGRSGGSTRVAGATSDVRAMWRVRVDGKSDTGPLFGASEADVPGEALEARLAAAAMSKLALGRTHPR
ncbi:MAG: hypothetical protein AB7T31_01125 [Gemmatimonadales bacterium]